MKKAAGKLSDRPRAAYRAANPDRKRAVNISLSGDLVDQAKDLDLNLSEIAEIALHMAVKHKGGTRWLSENAAAIKSYTDWVEKHGTFGDKTRLF